MQSRVGTVTPFAVTVSELFAPCVQIPVVSPVRNGLDPLPVMVNVASFSIEAPLAIKMVEGMVNVPLLMVLPEPVKVHFREVDPLASVKVPEE